MPNHVTNRLRFNGSVEQVKKVLDYVMSDIDNEEENNTTRIFDFNKVVPMPKELNVTDCSLGFSALYVLHNINPKTYVNLEYDKEKSYIENLSLEQRAEAVDLAMKYKDNIDKYGHPTWYEWCLNNWGTKWNSYSNEMISHNTIQFQTAWSSPIPVIASLSNLFPNIEMELTYADEDAGSNTGEIVFKYGDLVSANQPESCSSEGYEIFFDLHPDMRSYYKKTKSGYSYKG